MAKKDDETKKVVEKRRYRVRLITEMLGTVSKDPQIYKTYIESKKPEALAAEDESATVPKAEEKGWTGFHQDDVGLFIFEYMIKGQLKNAGNVLKDSLDVKALRSKIDDFVFVSPRRIYFNKIEPDGVIERPLRAMTQQGPRVTLARSDMVKAGTEMEFIITLFPHAQITWDTIDTLLRYGEFMGLGQFRNGGYGRFEILSVVKV